MAAMAWGIISSFITFDGRATGTRGAFMESILFTFKEAAYLWVRNFWYIILIVLLADLPQIGVSFALQQFHNPDHTLAISLETLAVFALGFFLVATLKATPILGLLRRQLTGRSPGAAIGHELAVSGWKIFIVIFIMGVLGALPLILANFIHVGPLHSHIAVKLLRYLLFFAIRFALPYPLVAQEGKNPFSAVGEAIGMTFRYFGFVLGCFAIFAVAQWFIDKITIHFLFGLPGTAYVLPLLWSLVDTGWIVLFWCIYLHIRDRENPAAEGHLETAPDELPGES